MEQLPEKIFWDIRTFVYRHFADTTHAPSVDETAARFALTHEEAASAYEALNNLHAFYLSDHALLPVGSGFRCLVASQNVSRGATLTLPQLWQLSQR